MKKNQPPLRGWVYVLINEAMPGLVKVGFSTKDPFLRAQEIGGTGNPHQYDVAFDVLVLAPREVEQRTHVRLAAVREGKEWFRCSIEQAVAAVTLEAGEARLMQWQYFGDEALTDEYREELRRQEEEENTRRAEEQRAMKIRKAREYVAYDSKRQFSVRAQLLECFILKTEGPEKASRQYGVMLDKTPLTSALLARAKQALADNEGIQAKMAEIILSGEYVQCSDLNCYTALKINPGVENHISCPACGEEIKVPASYAEGDTKWVYSAYGTSFMADTAWADLSYIAKHPHFLDSYQEFLAQVAEQSAQPPCPNEATT